MSELALPDGTEIKNLWGICKHSVMSARVDLYEDVAELIADYVIWKKIEPGQFVDAKDYRGRWYVSLIVKIKEFDPLKKISLYIRFLGWKRKWDEWVSLESDCIQPFGTHTDGIPYYFYSGQWISRNPASVNPGDVVFYGPKGGMVTKYKHPHVYITRGTEENEQVELSHIRVHIKSPKKKWKCHCGKQNEPISHFPRKSEFNMHDMMFWYCTACGCLFEQDECDYRDVNAN